MKIGILTLPLSINYGGVLQAYALQKYLNSLGHNAILIDRRLNKLGLLGYMKMLYLKYYKGRQIDNIGEIKKRGEQIAKFIVGNLEKTEAIYSDKNMREVVSRHDFDAVIVGSDQVWRLEYAPQLKENFFLNFIENPLIKKISYAASFGVDDWKLSSERKDVFKRLISQFDAISVREESGVDICRKELNVDASQQIDPTLLLEKSQYISAIKDVETSVVTKDVFAYFLDDDEYKSKVVATVAESKKSEFHKILGKPKKLEVKPGIEDWLYSFMKSKYIVTDSFHGCIFSIIFEKPFLVIGNVERGLTRFETLLKMFNLESRLVKEGDTIDKDIVEKEINWEEVRMCLKEKRALAKDFLESALA